MRIRKATFDDIASIIDLERDCSSAAHWTELQYRDLFASGVQRLALVAERMGDTPSEMKLLGFLIARHLAPEWELENIVVAPKARRNGIGKRLLERLLAAGRETNSESVFLEVRESNVGARALYDKLGFRQTGRRKSYYANPLEDAVLYSLILG